jgi:hypothetical protein
MTNETFIKELDMLIADASILEERFRCMKLSCQQIRDNLAGVSTPAARKGKPYDKAAVSRVIARRQAFLNKKYQS